MIGVKYCQITIQEVVPVIYLSCIITVLKIFSVYSNWRDYFKSLLLNRDYTIPQQIGTYIYKNDYNWIIVSSAIYDEEVNIILFNTKELGYAGNETKLSKW